MPAPIAVSDFYTTRPGVTLNVAAAFGLLANDSDPDGDSFSAISVNITGLNGALTAQGNGSFAFTPTAGFSGTTSFTYTIRDATGAFATATATINVFNSVPVASPDIYSMFSGEMLTVSAAQGFLTNDSDADGDALSAISVNITGLNGTVNAQATGAFDFTPTSGFSGTTRYSYTLGDGFGGFASANVTVFVVSRTSIDTLVSELSLDLTSTPALLFAENLTLVGTGGLSGFGNALSNQIVGNSGGNLLNGLGGSDTLYGVNGNDTLYGGDGNDTLFGGADVDNLLGERGNDVVSDDGGSGFIDGGGGRDVASFGFASTLATFSRSAAWSWNIANGADTDNLIGVEVAQFSDRNVALREAGRSDVSGDGTSDLVWYNQSAGLISMYEVNPAGGYTWRNIGAVGAGYTPFTGDFNGDGEADVMWFNGTSLSYYDVNPGGGYVWRNIGGVSPGHQTIVGDYDGDGTSDIAFFNQTTGALSWYDIDPAGGYVWRNIGAVGAGYTPLTGDFNGDGETDIGWFNGTSLSYYDITNSGGYVWNNIGAVGPGHTALTGDFNNDGTTDIAFINQATNAISFYAVNPNGGYTWHNIGAVAQGYAATAADVTNDGKTDIVFTGFGSVSYYDIGPTGGYTWHNIGGLGAGYVLVG